MKKPGEVPYGRRVRVVRDFDDSEIYPHWPSSTVIPAGTEGIVREGPYCSGIFIYDIVCPVQLDNVHELPGIAQTTGISWEVLEFAE